MDEIRCAHWFFRTVRVVSHLRRIFLLLVCNAANFSTLIEKLAFFAVELRQLITDANNLQQDFPFFCRTGLHEFGEIKCQLLYETIQELLSALLSARINDLQRTVLAGALYDKTIAEFNVQFGIRGTAVTMRGAWSQLIAAKCPGNGIQHGCFPLAVFPANNSQSALGRLQPNSLDALDVLDFEIVDLNHLCGASSGRTNSLTPSLIAPDIHFMIVMPFASVV